MKNIINKIGIKSTTKWMFIFALTAIVASSGCKDKDELDPPGSKLDGINSNWEMVDVVQIDIATLAQKELNVSNAFIGAKAMKIQFNASDFTYTVTPGSGPNYFGTAGTWAFDDNEYPTKITLTTSANETKVLPLVRTIRPVDAFLHFSYQRKCANADKPYIAYEFKFIRSN